MRQKSYCGLILDEPIEYPKNDAKISRAPHRDS